MARTNFLTPVGRLVAGSLYRGQTTDKNGKPKVIKTGPNAGQPRTEFYFGVAIPKTPGQHWASSEWGSVIWGVGHAAFPQGQAGAPTFAWKIIDGDSQVPNKAGKKPCDQEGYPGHWILNFSGSFAPSIYNKDGSVELKDPDVVKLGYYVQVSGNVDGNGSVESPGVYLNHDMVAFAGIGPVIQVGPDASAVGFGQAALPAGAQPVPATAMQHAMGAPAVPSVPAVPVPGAAAVPPVYAPPPAVPAPGAYVPPAVPAPVAAPPVVPVTPNPAFLAVPQAPLAPPPAAPARQMTAKAQGHTYEQLLSAGWTDATLVQHGLMLP